MNRATIFAGMIFGAVLAFGMIGGLQLSGLAVAGEDIITLDLTLNRSSAVALTTPRELTRLAIDGVYSGSGEVRIDLVGPNRTWRVAEYRSPERLGNASFLLQKGGTVVRLDQGLTYEHRFVDACGETCEESMEGPFLLQVAVTKGNLTLAAVTYDSPAIITVPVTPENVTQNVTLPEENRTEPGRINIAPECTVDSECGSRVCVANYCVSPSGHLNITDSKGELVALFDKYGRVLLAGDLHEHSSAAPPENAFLIETPIGVAAWITDTGDLHLKGSAHEEAAEIPIVGSQNFIVRNETEEVCVVQGFTGDLFTRDVVVTSALG